MTQETYRPAFPQDTSRSFQYISYGVPYPEACTRHVKDTFHCKRVYILASGSLSRNTDKVTRLTTALESEDIAVVGTVAGIRSHSYYSDIVRIVTEAKAAKADCLVTLGAGSLTDAAKVIVLALANDANTVDELETISMDSPREREILLTPTIPIICVPTSLSAGEYTRFAGATNDETHHKHMFHHISMTPRLVILDPDLAKTTPERIWLSTGIRAVDHCVESICSIEANPESDGLAEKGLRKLLPGLLRTKKNPELLDPRLDCQLGAVDAIASVGKIPLGASHGIGHQLGPLGVGHGETSCVLLPAVCKYNKDVNGERQRQVLDVLWSEPSIKQALKGRGLEVGKANLSDTLDGILRELEMPRSLKEVGVGTDRFDDLAVSSLSDRWCKTNPISLTKKEQVMEILEAVAGDQSG